MNTIDAAVQALGWALLHFVWQGALVGLVAAGLLAQLRHARAQARYAVACVALFACLLLPVATLLRGAPEASPTASTVPSDVGDGAMVPAASPAGPARAATVAHLRESLRPRLPAVVVAWSIGAALLALRMGLGLAWVARVGAAGYGRPHADWQARLDALARRMALPRRVLLRVVDGLDSPVVARALKPIVLVPAALVARMSPDLLEALLAHELAHVRRHDYLANLVQGAIEALLFYHPVVWWLSRTIRRERELIADDIAAQTLGDRRRLALALDALASLQTRPEPVPTLALAADGGQLMSRIQQLVRPRRPYVQWKAALPVIGISLLCLSLAQARTEPPVAADESPFRSQGTLTVGRDADRDGYALVTGDDVDGVTFIDAGGNAIDTLKALRARIDGEFLWVRRDGREYLVTDPDVLAKVRAAWDTTRPVGRQMEALGAEMEKHGAVMEQIGTRMEAAADLGSEDAKKMEALGRQMSALGAEQAELAARQARLSHDAHFADDAEARARAASALDAASADVERVSSRMDALSEEMDRHSGALERAHAPLDALSGEMDRASKPMEALGDRMDGLGKEMERLSGQAEAVTRSAIDAAARDGKLVPVDRAVSL